MYHNSISETEMIFTRWSHFHRPTHAVVAAQLPADYLLPAEARDSLAPTAGATSRAGRATKVLLAHKAGWVDMFALADMLAHIVDFQADYFCCSMHLVVSPV